MTPQQSYLEFAPPPTPGLLRGVLLALVAHGILLAIVAAGVHWQREAPIVTAEAELWAAIPREAARPRPQAPEQAPAPAPARPLPKVTPAPVHKPVAAPPQPEPSIAIAQEKAKRLNERQQRELQKKENKLKEKQLADKASADKLEKAKKAKAAKEAKAKPQESATDIKKLEEVRATALKRMASLAADSGSDTNQGQAAQSSGPSAGYAGRIRARIKPNITFTDTISGNPVAEVEVRTSLDGTIVSRRLGKSSGQKSWDDAVLSAIDKTEVLPRDVDGRIPAVLVISFRPRD